MNRRHLLLLPSLLAMLASPHAAVSKPGLAERPARLPENLAPTFPREGVDHVATYALRHHLGAKGGDRVVLRRHGALVRTDTDHVGSGRANESAHSEDYANLATSAALTVARDDKGSVTSVRMTRNGPDDIPFYRHVIAATKASETIAGERCTVWTAKPETQSGVARTSCITGDGIVLRETVLFHDGSVMTERRATHVARRQVETREVLPPADALHWTSWAETESPIPAAAGEAENYELELAGTKDREPTVKVMRKAGGWYSEQDDVGASVRLFHLSGPGLALSYDNRTYPRITVSRNRPATLMGSFGVAPLDRPGQQVIGEHCTWYNAAVNVADYGRLECRTHDGLALLTEEYGRGTLRASWAATELSRGQVTPGSFKPLALLMDWTFWGWPQLDRR